MGLIRLIRLFRMHSRQFFSLYSLSDTGLVVERLVVLWDGWADRWKGICFMRVLELGMV